MDGWTARDVGDFRRYLDLSQEAFARRLGVSVATVRRCEMGGPISARAQDRLDALLVQTVAYLDDAFSLLGASMGADQRTRLQAILADIAIFAGDLSFLSGQQGRASAFLTFAEDQAREAGDLA